MGTVFLGRSAAGRLVAVKVIRDELAEDPDLQVRFRREVAAARKVSGPFTAPVADADLDAPPGTAGRGRRQRCREPRRARQVQDRCRRGGV
jgi:hypothetical protein